MSTLGQRIFQRKNVEAAYLELAKRLDESGKSRRLRGIDGVSLRSMEIRPAALVDQVIHELKEHTPCAPAIEKFIPKGDGSNRTIYVYRLVDRVKSRSIERQLEPIVEALYAKSLFSYRPGKSSHQAARTVIRRYGRRYGQDYFARCDVAQYTDTIDHQILRSKLAGIVQDPLALQMINLFIGNPILQNWQVVQPLVGVVQGVGMIGLFYNVYLAELDWEMERRVQMYRRVGDDMFLADPDRERLQESWRYLQNQIRLHKIELHPRKTQVGINSTAFDYLGYSFRDNKVGVKADSVNKLLNFYRSRLRWVPINQERKLARLEMLWSANQFELHRKGLDFIFSHRFANDEEQIQEISNEFYRILTRYFFRDYTSERQAQVRKMTADIPIISLSKLYYLITHGQASFKSLAVPRTQSATTRK